MSCTHIEPVWVVEHRFNLPPGYLKGKAHHISAEYTTTALHTNRMMYRDLLEWKESGQLQGRGSRVTGVNATMGQALDQLTDDNDTTSA